MMAAKGMTRELSESYIKSSTIPEDATLKTLSDCLKHHAATRPDKEAVVFVGVDGSREVVTFAELYENSVRAARGFMQLGVKRHELVAVNVRTCPDWLYINFGIILAGACVTHFSFIYKDGSDIVPMMKKFDTCSTLVLDTGVEKNWNIFKKLIDDHSLDGTVKSAAMPNLKYLVVLDPPKDTPGLKSFHDILTDAPSSIEVPCLDADDVITLFETSGSSGEPKSVAHTHKSFLAYCRAGKILLDYCTVNNHGQNKEDSGKHSVDPSNHKVYNDRPFSWIGGSVVNVQFGATRVIPSGLQEIPEDTIAFTLDVITRENCDALSTVPTLLHPMIERVNEFGPDLRIQCAFIGGQPTTNEFANCVGSLCERLVSLYGGTEFGVASALMVDDINDFEEYSCGYPLPGVEIKVVDESGKTVPVGESGEVYIRSNQMFQQYWNDPQKTNSVLSADGWFKTDDMGHVSKKGALFVEGRKSDVIISDSIKMSPAVLERDIKKCPDVANVMIVPIPHPSLYQAVCACVIPAAGNDVTEDALRRYCESIHNDEYTVIPHYYLIFEKFPQTSSGKVSRKELASIAEKRLKEL